MGTMARITTGITKSKFAYIFLRGTYVCTNQSGSVIAIPDFISMYVK